MFNKEIIIFSTMSEEAKKAMEQSPSLNTITLNDFKNLDFWYSDHLVDLLETYSVGEQPMVFFNGYLDQLLYGQTGFGPNIMGIEVSINEKLSKGYRVRHYAYLPDFYEVARDLCDVSKSLDLKDVSILYREYRESILDFYRNSSLFQHRLFSCLGEVKTFSGY